jgi:hypothetical protein
LRAGFSRYRLTSENRSGVRMFGATDKLAQGTAAPLLNSHSRLSIRGSGLSRGQRCFQRTNDLTRSRDIATSGVDAFDQ